MQLPKTEAYQKIVREGYRLLGEQRAYSQTDIQKKMASLGYEASRPSLSNIISGKRKAGREALYAAGEAMLLIVQSELGYSFDYERLCFDENSRPPDWKPVVVPLPENDRAGQDGILFHAEGRLSIQDKVNFLKDARHEVIEFGIRLKAFTHYFLSRNAHEFRNHIEELLARGVHLKLYLLDPGCNAARFYFEDRSIVLPDEARSGEVIKEVVELLRQVKEELSAGQHPGTIEAFQYRRLPYCHFLIVDGESRHGKMMVSPYLYGIRRADCPVVQLSRNADRSLYRRYWTSFQHLTRDALPILL